MTLTAQSGVSIAEVVVYTPMLLLALYVCMRHGFTKAAGWIYIMVLCLVRIVGPICQLVAVDHPSHGLIEAAFILEFIGLAPLLFATLALVNRVNEWTSTLSEVRWPVLARIMILLATILCLAGINTQAATMSTTIKAGVALYLVALVLLFLVFLMMSTNAAAVPREERRIFWALGVAFPLLLVRVLYSILAVFLDNQTFSILRGDVGIHAGMAVVEEFLVVLDYVVLGLVLPQRAALRSSETTRYNEYQPARRDGRASARKEHVITSYGA